MTEQDPGLPEKQPVVGVPVAGLPGEQQATALPAAEPPAGGLPGWQPGIYQPVAEVAATPRKSIVLPAVLAVLMVLATGVFLALWLIERGDHKATTGQLDGVRAEIADVEKKTGAAQTTYTDTETKLKAAETGLAEKKAETDKHKPCSDAGRELQSASTDPAIDAALNLLMERCK